MKRGEGDATARGCLKATCDQDLRDVCVEFIPVNSCESSAQIAEPWQQLYSNDNFTTGAAAAGWEEKRRGGLCRFTRWNQRQRHVHCVCVCGLAQASSISSAHAFLSSRSILRFRERVDSAGGRLASAAAAQWQRLRGRSLLLAFTPVCCR